MNPIERRLTALEGRTGDNLGRIIYAATAGDAERHHATAIEPNIYVVTTSEQQPPVITGSTIIDMMQYVAEHGRRITDRTKDAVSDWKMWRQALPPPRLDDRTA